MLLAEKRALKFRRNGTAGGGEPVRCDYERKGVLVRPAGAMMVT